MAENNDKNGRVLTVVTRHTDLGDTGRKTGFHFEELATPYYRLADAGFEVVIGSVGGGPADPDPSSQKPRGDNPESVERFLGDPVALSKVADTAALDSLSVRDFDALYLPGGHGTMWDLPASTALAGLVSEAWQQGKPVAAVCHGPAGLLEARDGEGRPLVEGRRINCFTDEEERHVGLESVVPFLLQSRLEAMGARFEKADKFQPKVVADGNLITGQNPASADGLAERLVASLS